MEYLIAIFIIVILYIISEVINPDRKRYRIVAKQDVVKVVKPIITKVKTTKEFEENFCPKLERRLVNQTVHKLKPMF